MQAYHQQIANLNLPNGTSSLLIASPSQFANLQPQNHQHQQSSYQDLVKAYLPQLNTMSTTGVTSLSTSPASSSPSSSLSSSSPSSMASFAVRLMSLNAHELKCLNSDNELMRHIHEAQVLIDNRLHDINSKSGADQSRHNKQHINHHQSSPNQLNLNLAFVQQHQEQQIHLQQQQQQQHILMSSDSYYQNYYAQQLALSQMAQLQQHQHHQQQQQHQQHILLMDSGYNSNKSANYHVDSRNDIGQQQNNLTTQSSPSNSGENNGHLERVNASQQQLSIPALDLRTTPTRPVSDTPSPTSMRSRSGSTESARNSRQQQHPKKAKLTEYRKMQQSTDGGVEGVTQGTCSTGNQKQQLNNMTQYQDISNSKTSTTLVSNENFPNQADSKRSQQLSLPSKRMHQANEHHQDLATLNSNIANTRSSRLQSNQNGKLAVSGCGGGNAPVPGVKKHKGEFDEPNPSEVAERERQLSRPEHYHGRALQLGTCACIIGSEFSTKTPREALEQLDKWRSLDIERRIKWKWDLNDLPKDIPLSDIKKFEDLRRDYSNGRADFGGASKRKPLGIRGTRQFLLMLYCLWGHPGRDDPMQQDGYCPHCFAKIRTENEQSTLVRVVNHFNMKHRRGANPRLSPETRTTTTPQDQLICETLESVVETAVASTEGEQPATSKS